jgi:hypothetical protein
MLSRALAPVLLLTLCWAGSLPAQYQTWSRAEVLDRWRNVAGTDTATLTGLRCEGRRYAGEGLLSTLLDVVRSESRPPRVRVAATSELLNYVVPDGRAYDVLWSRYEVAAERARNPPPPPQAMSNPLAITVVAPDPGIARGRASSHPHYSGTGSIDPARKDAIRATLLDLSRSSPDPGIRDVARVAARALDAEKRLACLAHLRSGGAPNEGCLDAAPALVQAWREVRDDSTAWALMHETQALSDRRILAILQRVVLDESATSTIRQAALSAIATLVDPVMNTLGIRDRTAPSCVNWGWHTHYAVQEAGVVPIRSVDRAGAVDFLLRTGRRGGDGDVRWMARFLGTCLRRSAAEAPFPSP